MEEGAYYLANPEGKIVILIFCFVHFLLAPKMNQKRAVETPTTGFLSARYTDLIDATKKPLVRAVSGFAPAPILQD